jgi:type IV pilus assembly protein PilE
MSQRFSSGARQRGFTLIELMVTVAVVSILAAIAYPSYQAYILRSKLIDGTTKLSDYRVQMEQYFLDNHTYARPAGSTTCAITFVPTPRDEFLLTCAGNDTTYTWTATGLATSLAHQFTYTVNQLNTHATTSMPSGWNTTNQLTCWIVRTDGTCG